MRAGKGSLLEAAVADAIESEVVGVQGLVSSALDYDAFLAHRYVRRMSGFAMTATGRFPWSLIEKTTGGPAVASAYLVDNGRRELAAYRSGLLAELPAGVRAPALHGVDERPDGGIVLLLEDVRQDADGATAQDSIIRVARDLGRLSGTWFHRLMPETWLFQDWIERHSQSVAQAAGREALLRNRSRARARLGSQVDLGIGLIDAQPRIAALLGSLPQTLCHHDAVGANILRCNGMSVLIDWESVGPGVVGADLASLLFSSARRGDCSAGLISRCFDPAVAAFVDGLHEMGADIDPADVRLGVDAAIALRWKLLFDIAVALEEGTAVRRGSATGEAPAAAMDELVVLCGILEAAADRVLAHC